jgi:hypothetical protein
MGYKTALICFNGHIINGNMEDHPKDNQNFCSECGAKTINSCQQCGTKIRGDQDYGFEYYMLQFVPNYCGGCGTAFPWLEEKLKAAKELADEMEELTAEEREKLKASIDDLIIDGPRTELAAARFKKIIAKVGNELANGMRNIVIDIVSETAKKLIFGNQN